MRRSCSLLAVLVLAFATTAATPEPPRPAGGAHWLLVSDVHFNPYDDPAIVDALLHAPPSKWRAIFAAGNTKPNGFLKDTNFALLESSLAAMKAQIPDPPLVVIAGDFLAHNFPETFARDEPKTSRADYERFVDDTMAFLAAEFASTFPDSQFLITLGNNDGYCGDYNSEPDSPFLAHVAAAWEPLVDRGGRAADFVPSFSHGGYYTATLPTAAPAQAVVLNSVFWSAKSTNACGVPGSDPGAAEIAWLKKTVAQPAGSYRWLLTHIPPSVDAFSSMRKGAPVPFYDEKYLADVIDSVASPSSHVATFIVGHEHHAAFKLIGGEGGPRIPALVVPAISPVQLSNPAFMIADVDASTGTIVDVATYALALEATPPAWHLEYDFDASYGVKSLSAESLARVRTSLENDPAARALFEEYHPAGSKLGRMVDTTWPSYWCGIEDLTSAAFARCVAAKSEKTR